MCCRLQKVTSLDRIGSRVLSPGNRISSLGKSGTPGSGAGSALKTPRLEGGSCEDARKQVTFGTESETGMHFSPGGTTTGSVIKKKPKRLQKVCNCNAPYNQCQLQMIRRTQEITCKCCNCVLPFVHTGPAEEVCNSKYWHCRPAQQGSLLKSCLASERHNFMPRCVSAAEICFCLQANENSGTGGKKSAVRKRKALIELLDQASLMPVHNLLLSLISNSNYRHMPAMLAKASSLFAYCARCLQS